MVVREKKKERERERESGSHGQKDPEAGADLGGRSDQGSHCWGLRAGVNHNRAASRTSPLPAHLLSSPPLGGPPISLVLHSPRTSCALALTLPSI